MKRQNIFIGTAIGLSLATILLGVFLLGVFVGRHGKRQNLERHGTVGTIETLGESTLLVKEKNGALKTVLVDNQTKIRQGRMSINFSDLKIAARIIVLGVPQKDEQAIKAKIIRILGNNPEKDATGSGRLPPF